MEPFSASGFIGAFSILVKDLFAWFSHFHWKHIQMAIDSDLSSLSLYTKFYAHELSVSARTMNRLSGEGA